MKNYQNEFYKDRLNIKKGKESFTQVIGDCGQVCFIIRTHLGKGSITLLDYQWIVCSEWVPSE